MNHCLSASAVLAAVFAASATAQESVRLNGIVRDFRSTHADFPGAASAGPGHYAGTVSELLSENGAPAHTMGYKVSSQWTDSSDRNIAPHLYSAGGMNYDGAAFLVDGDVYLRQGSVDSFDPDAGPFGDGNSVGGAAIFTNSTSAGSVQLLNEASVDGMIVLGAGAVVDDVVEMDGDCSVTGGFGVLPEPIVMPTVTAPEGMGDSSGNALLGNTVISDDQHFDRLEINKNRTVTIVGDVRIQCDDGFGMQNSASIVLGDDATLTLYVAGGVEMENNSRINENTNDPSRVSILLMDGDTFELQNRNRVYAVVTAPESEFNIQNNAELGGTFAVGSLVLNSGGSALHMAGSFSADDAEACGVFSDELGSAGVSSSGGVASVVTFNGWFVDNPSWNMSVCFDLELEFFAGEWTYAADEFYPVDDMLFGNEVASHNSLFTYEVVANGHFDACEDLFFEVSGGDGCWVFINGELAIDLGGTLTGVTQRIDLDRLNLEDGEAIEVRMFYASRNPVASELHVRTNIEFESAPDEVFVAYSPFD